MPKLGSEPLIHLTATVINSTRGRKAAIDTSEALKWTDMKRAALALLAACLLSPLAFARDRSSCIASAQAERDRCLRQTGGDDIANRRCMDRYLNASNRCRLIPAERFQPRRQPGLGR